MILYSTSGFWYLSESKYEQLNEQQKKFFTRKDYQDAKGNPVYRMKVWEERFFYVPVLAKHKIKSEFLRAQLPDIRKYVEKFWNTGFGRKYLIQDHRSDRYNIKGQKKQRQRQIQREVAEGLEEYLQGE